MPRRSGRPHLAATEGESTGASNQGLCHRELLRQNTSNCSRAGGQVDTHALMVATNTDFAAAACFGIPLLTAHRALAMEKGARVIATVSSDKKAAMQGPPGPTRPSTTDPRTSEPGSRRSPAAPV